jgi:2-phospho-L-lactate/phosphoenolpyruvate guanylyltransferase
VIVAAVPVKDLVNAKQRLVPALSSRERGALARAMLADVLGALERARLDQIWIVTRDPEVRTLAARRGCRVLEEPENAGHTAAVARAQQTACVVGARIFVTVPGDVPCVSPEEIDALVSAVSPGPGGIAFAPSRSRLGTNGVALAPPDALTLTFGEPSFERHLAAARARGVVPRVLSLDGLGLDIDGPADLQALLAEGASTESGRLLASWSVRDRLTARVPARS